ncbi:MAG: fucose isomerase, partial [Candidatus Rifleibacteriota bacterium]
INQTFISMKEFVNILGHQRVIAGTEFQKKFTGKMSDDELKKAEKVYLALKKTIQNYGLTALSLRCFDILELEKTTGCLALSALNDEGIIAGCEGDMPTAVSMLLAGRLTQKPVFMANPSRVSQNEAVFAHCTVPCTITSEYSLDTHFESGIGVAVSGKFAEGPVTLFKIGAAGQSCAIGEGEILSMPHAADLCRTQARVNMAGIENYLLNNPLGNHQVLIPGHVGKRLEQAASLFGLQQVFQRDFA